MNWEFKPEDFKNIAIHCCGACACDVVDTANKKLQEWLSKATVVYGTFDGDGAREFSAMKVLGSYRGADTHKALLIKIEPLVKCDHDSGVRTCIGDTGATSVYYECVACDAKVKPSAWGRNSPQGFGRGRREMRYPRVWMHKETAELYVCEGHGRLLNDAKMVTCGLEWPMRKGEWGWTYKKYFIDLGPL